MVKHTDAPYRLYTRGKTYHAYFSFRTVGGQRIQLRESTCTTDRRKAEQYCLKRVGELQHRAERKEKGELEEMSIDAAFGRYFEESGQYQSKPDNLLNRLSQISTILNCNYLSEITEEKLSDYVSIRSKTVKSGTLNRELAIISAVVNMARDKWKVKTVYVKIRKFMMREPSENVKYLKTWKDAQNIIDAAPDHIKPIIYTALYTGLRLGNILNLKWSDIDFENSCITVLVKDRGKLGGKVFTVPMIDSLRRVIENQPKTNEFVFTYKGRPIQSIKTAWKHLFKRSGLPYINFHTLRHTAATWILKKTGNLKITKEILGHANIATTLKYAHILDDEKRQALKKVFEEIK